MRILDRLLIGGVMGALGVLSFSSPVVAQEQTSGRIRCESIDGKPSRCQVPWRDAELVTQESKDACVRGQSWGLDREGLWVDRGCRGQFAETFRDGPRGRDGRDSQENQDSRDSRHGDQGGGYVRDGGDGGRQPGADWNRQIRLQCDSHQNNYRMCQVDVGRQGRVELVKQLSGARCTEGDSWGWNRAGVWVDHGCRGQFMVDRRW